MNEERALYTVPAKCCICKCDYLARKNIGRRAKVCTPPEHECQSGFLELPSGASRRIRCIEKCCRWKYLNERLSQSMDSPIDPKKFLNDKEFAALIARSHEIQDSSGIAIRFIANTGVRIAEALLVQCDDLLLDEEFPLVQVPTMKRKGHPNRGVHLWNPAFVEELRKVIDGKADGESLIGCPRRTLQRRFEALKKELGLRKFGGIHVLRHTRASQLVNAGYPYNYIRHQLGWTKIEPLITYDHRDLKTIAGLAGQLPKHGSTPQAIAGSPT